MPGVLDLHVGEILRGGAVEVDATTRVEREVRRVGHTHEAEAQPVRVVPTLTGDGSEETLGGGVRADDQGNFAEAGQDSCASGVECLGSRRTRGVRRGDASAVPAECLREGGSGDVSAVAVADGLAADDEVDILPIHTRIGERGASGRNAVFHERLPPLAPGVHTDTEYCDVLAHDCNS